MQALCKTTDGFKIAEQDLALRGPGDFFGSRQHGLPLLKVASLQMDLETLRDAQQAAAAVIQTADSLNAPELAPLKARVEALFTRQEVSPLPSNNEMSAQKTTFPDGVFIVCVSFKH